MDIGHTCLLPPSGEQTNKILLRSEAKQTKSCLTCMLSTMNMKTKSCLTCMLSNMNMKTKSCSRSFGSKKHNFI